MFATKAGEGREAPIAFKTLSGKELLIYKIGAIVALRVQVKRPEFAVLRLFQSGQLLTRTKSFVSY